MTPDVIDRERLLPRISGAKLDLGCGPTKVSPEHVGVDMLDVPGVDLVGDVFDVLSMIADGVVEEVHTSHFLEHIPDFEPLLGEIARVLRPGGALTIVVPHFSNPYYYSDTTHVHSFGLYTMAYFTTNSPFKRAVPNYGRSLPFQHERVALEFRAARPFYGRYAVKRLIELLVNLTRGAQEFYEELLVYILPCYQIRYVLRRS